MSESIITTLMLSGAIQYDLSECMEVRFLGDQQELYPSLARYSCGQNVEMRRGVLHNLPPLGITPSKNLRVTKRLHVDAEVVCQRTLDGENTPIEKDGYSAVSIRLSEPFRLYYEWLQRWSRGTPNAQPACLLVSASFATSFLENAPARFFRLSQRFLIALMTCHASKKPCDSDKQLFSSSWALPATSNPFERNVGEEFPLFSPVSDIAEEKEQLFYFNDVLTSVHAVPLALVRWLLDEGPFLLFPPSLKRERDPVLEKHPQSSTRSLLHSVRMVNEQQEVFLVKHKWVGGTEIVTRFYTSH